MSKRTVTYTVHTVEGSLVETTALTGRQQWALGRVRAQAYGDDGSLHDWEILPGQPQPYVGSRFTHEIDIPDEDEPA